MAEVHSLFGVTVPLGEPVQGVVELLESTLEAARRGEVAAIALTWVAPTRDIEWTWECGIMPLNTLLAGAAMLQHRIASRALDEE